MVCEDSSIISLADDGGIELRNYDIVIIRFNSNCNFCNSMVCEDSAINIYHSPSVICHN